MHASFTLYFGSINLQVINKINNDNDNNNNNAEQRLANKYTGRDIWQHFWCSWCYLYKSIVIEINFFFAPLSVIYIPISISAFWHQLK